MSDNNGIDFEIYSGKSLGSLFKDIVTNAEQRRIQLEILISELKPLIKTVNDALQIVPLIKQYMDSAIDNDAHLVRLAAVVQRLVASHSSGSENGDLGFVLSEAERIEIQKELDKFAETKTIPVKKVEKKS